MEYAPEWMWGGGALGFLASMGFGGPVWLSAVLLIIAALGLTIAWIKA